MARQNACFPIGVFLLGIMQRDKSHIANYRIPASDVIAVIVGTFKGTLLFVLLRLV